MMHGNETSTPEQLGSGHVCAQVVITAGCDQVRTAPVQSLHALCAPCPLCSISAVLHLGVLSPPFPCNILMPNFLCIKARIHVQTHA